MVSDEARERGARGGDGGWAAHRTCSPSVRPKGSAEEVDESAVDCQLPDVLSAQMNVGLLVEPVNSTTWSPDTESATEPLTDVSKSDSVSTVPAGRLDVGVCDWTPSVSRRLPSLYTPSSVRKSVVPDRRVSRRRTPTSSGLSAWRKTTAQPPASRTSTGGVIGCESGGEAGKGGGGDGHGA